MRVIRDLQTWSNVRQTLEGSRIGLVPTMGALHNGHLELIRRSAAENDHTIVTVFVNAPQFDDPRDLAAYPRSLDDDATVAESAGAGFLLAPEHAAIYPDGYRYRVTETELSRTLEGAYRPGHFDGVLTVVLKLLNLARPHRAYFGEKDYQQYLLVRGMVEALLVPIEIVSCPTVRDADGLALSSRNVRLPETARQRAALFPPALASGEPLEVVRRSLEQAGFEVDYIVDTNGRRYGAVRIGGVRLIDNMPLLAHS